MFHFLLLNLMYCATSGQHSQCYLISVAFFWNVDYDCITWFYMLMSWSAGVPCNWIYFMLFTRVYVHCNSLYHLIDEIYELGVDLGWSYFRQSLHCKVVKLLLLRLMHNIFLVTCKAGAGLHATELSLLTLLLFE